MQTYSDPTRADSTHALPDVEVFQLTSEEVALNMPDEICEYGKRFPLCHMNSITRQAMIDAMVEELSIRGGWYWWTRLPGCLPGNEPFGPFDSAAEAEKDAQDILHRKE